MPKALAKKKPLAPGTGDYTGLVGGIGELLDVARRASARTVNAFMTATYWEVGRRIVEFEQGGKERAQYGGEVLTRLADDLTARFGRGFSRFNLGRFRQFYLASPADQIRATLSLKSPETQKRATLSLELPEAEKAQTASAELSGLHFNLADLARAFPLPWSHYVLLISRSRSPAAFAFYHAEALRGGWSEIRAYLRHSRALYCIFPAKVDRPSLVTTDPHA